MSKALGQEINDFYNNHFPENSFIDEDEDWIEDYQQEGVGLSLPPNEKFELSAFGVIVDENNDNVRTFSSVFKKWQRSRTIAYILVEIDASKKEEVVADLKRRGYKIKS